MMMFSNSRSYSRNNPQYSSMNFVNSQTSLYRPANVNFNTPVHVETTPPPPKKMKWGEPTWFFLHTMAQKIKPEYFQQVRQGLLYQINSICRNLPCPDCAGHAAQYLDKSNFNRIQSKEELITFLYNFHNVINKKKGFQIFPKEDLYDKYSKANTINIVNNFLFHYSDKSKSIRMISNDMFRTRVVSDLKVWMNNNLQYFDL
jgi:hypothetical protein